MQPFQPDPEAPIPIRPPTLASGPEAFSAGLAALQPQLRGYIATLLPGCSEIDDVLQEVNVLIWEKRDEFGGAGNFRGWAFRCAYFKALAWRRDAIRSGWLVFSETLMQKVAHAAEDFWDHRTARRSAALQECVGSLTPEDGLLLKARYERGTSLAQLAARTGKTADAVYKAISRLRAALRTCVERKLSREEPTQP